MLVPSGIVVPAMSGTIPVAAISRNYRKLGIGFESRKVHRDRIVC